jgi:hypothetical protein
MRIPEPLVDPVWASSSFMKTPSACSSSGAHQPVPTSGSVGTTPASTKTTGTKNARWRVLVTMVANALSLESTRFHSSAGTAPSKQHGTGTRSLAGEPRTSPGRCGAVLPSKRGEARTFERIDELSGRRGILVRLPRRPRRRGHCCQRCTTATHIVPASLRTSGRDRCEDLTPGDASRATIRGNERSWLGTRTTAKLLRRRQPRATTRPDRTSAITIACLKEERHDHIQAATCR